MDKRIQWRLYQACLLLNDTFAILLALLLAYLIRFRLNLPIFNLQSTGFTPFYSKVIAQNLLVWLLVFAISGLYQKKHLLGGTEEYARVFRANSTGFLLVILAGFLDPSFIIARGWLVMAWLLSFFFTATGRFLLRRGVYGLRLKGYFVSRAVIVGANDEGLRLAQQFACCQNSGLIITGFLDQKFPQGTILSERWPVLGCVDQLGQVIEKHKIEEVILASSAYTSKDNFVQIFKNHGISNGTNLRMSSGLYEIITTGLTVEELAYVPLVHVNKVRLTGIDRALKLSLDFSLVLPGLIFAFPLLLAAAIAVKLDSPGPVFHRRRVMGVNGREFDAYKFRSMVVNGDEVLSQSPGLKEELERTGKLKVDPRVTRVGKILRKFSIDELPQLINVLKLDMSLVGPRMISPPEMEHYHPWGINLLTVRPGITGLWQVSGRSDISYDERVRLDMHYIRNWNIWLDLQLLFRTIPVVLRGHGAY